MLDRYNKTHAVVASAFLAIGLIAGFYVADTQQVKLSETQDKVLNNCVKDGGNICANVSRVNYCLENTRTILADCLVGYNNQSIYIN